VIDPASGFAAIADVLIEDDLVVALDSGMARHTDARVINAEGLVVTPGFVDLHTHLRFPGFPEKETIESGTLAAAAGGFTTVCAMANTSPVVDDVETLRHVYQEAGKVGVVHVRQLAAVTRGLSGESITDFSRLSDAGAVAVSDDGKPVWNENVMREALTAARELGKAISVHEEVPEIVAAGVANEGENARLLGLPEWPCTGESRIVERDLRILRQTGGHLHVAHVSCSRTVELVRRAREEGLQVTAEATPHHLLLSDELLNGNEELVLPARHPYAKVNPPLRSRADVEALIEGLAQGVIDAVATDHAPQAEADKQMPFEAAAFGFTGIELALPLLLDLVRSDRLDLPTLVERLTAGPARCFKLEAGTLAPGARADVCIFDPDREWIVAPESLFSKGKNTPLLGAKVRGRVTHAIVSGKLVHKLL